MVVEFLLYIIAFLCVTVVVIGFMSFDEWEIYVEFIHPRYNGFEIGVSNRNYHLEDGGIEQELRIGFIFVSLVVVFSRIDA